MPAGTWVPGFLSENVKTWHRFWLSQIDIVHNNTTQVQKPTQALLGKQHVVPDTFTPAC